MKANPGGQIDLSQLIGRDKLLKRLSEILDRQSLVLTGVRRIGKTSIIKRMQADAPPEKLMVFSDLEKVHSSLEFVETIIEDTGQYLSVNRRAGEVVRRIATSLGGAEIGGVFKFPKTEATNWKPLLTRTIGDLVAHQKQAKQQFVFLWDELPMMLDNIKKREGEPVAMEVLDTLRALRQTHPELRMVFTGSIGLHHIITSLKQAGYSNAPINDMHRTDVPPVAAADAKDLAIQLLEGEEIPTDDPEVVSQATAQASDNIPFYIHHLVDRMKEQGGTMTGETVEEILLSFLTDPQDPWDMRHYRQRLDTYYRPDECPAAINLLDVLSIVDQPLTLSNLFSHPKCRIGIEDEERARYILTLLQSDHYVTLNRDGKYSFRFPLIRRWWVLHRG